MFDDIDKVLIDLSTIRGGVSIISLMSVARIPVGITKCKSYFKFFSNNSNSQKITQHNKKQKGKA